MSKLYHELKPLVITKKQIAKLDRIRSKFIDRIDFYSEQNPRELGDEDFAQSLAGLIDGDGSFPKNNKPYCSIAFNFRDREYAQRIVERLGFGNVYPKKRCRDTV